MHNLQNTHAHAHARTHARTQTHPHAHTLTYLHIPMVYKKVWSMNDTFKKVKVRSYVAQYPVLGTVQSPYTSPRQTCSFTLHPGRPVPLHFTPGRPVPLHFTPGRPVPLHFTPADLFLYTSPPADLFLYTSPRQTCSFTLHPRHTCSFQRHIDFSATLQLFHEDCSFTYPLLSVSRYSFIQLSGQGQRGVNEKGIRTRVISIERPTF